jgi:hypothetical protein
MLLRPTVVIVIAAAGVLAFTLVSAAHEWSAMRAGAGRIETIDYYGLQHITASQLKNVLGLRDGDAAPVNFLGNPNLFMRVARPLSGVATMQSLESKLRAIPGIRDASVVSIQGDDTNRRAIFVGISENDAQRPRRAYNGSATLPQAVTGLYDRHAERFMAVVANPPPDFDDDDSRGYALFPDATLRALEDQAIAFVQSEPNRRAAVVVLRTSADVKQRRTGAWLLTYGPDPRETAATLTEAVEDTDDDVRNTACRELAIVSDYVRKNPRLGIRIAPGPFIRMLNSVVWTDRDKAMAVLDPLTAGHDGATLIELSGRPGDRFRKWRAGVPPPMQGWRTS